MFFYSNHQIIVLYTPNFIFYYTYISLKTQKSRIQYLRLVFAVRFVCYRKKERIKLKKNIKWKLRKNLQSTGNVPAGLHWQMVNFFFSFYYNEAKRSRFLWTFIRVFSSQLFLFFFFSFSLFKPFFLFPSIPSFLFRCLLCYVFFIYISLCITLFNNESSKTYC